MGNSEFDRKIQEVFGEFAIDKGLVRRLGASGDDRHVPSYVMDWIVTHSAKSHDSTGAIERAVQDFIARHLPAKGEKERIRFLLSQGETLVLLDAISVTVKLGKDIRYFASIDCLDEAKALIDPSIIEQNQGLLQGSTWGAVKIGYDGSPEGGGIRIMDFKPMQTGRISLNVFQECRQAFTVEEWLDLLIRTLGYEPSMYAESEKVWMLCRLIPLVQNRINLMELAPPGSGKSYIYNNVSRHVWLTAGEITPAVLFYNRQKKAPGLLTRYDVLVLDEAQSLRFSNESEMQAQLKGYLEQGVYARGECRATAECGLVLLANIELQQQAVRRYKNGKPMFAPARPDYIRKLPEIFHESPTVDRFHGIIPGWEIPPFETQQQADGLGLKADYFAEVCHAMRTAPEISQAVRGKLRLAGSKRDCTAIERLACGLAKLLLIGPDHPRFDELVVHPASELRRLVRTQLHALDPQGYSPDLQIERFESLIKRGTTLGRIAHYELLEEIGHGGMASVYKGLDTRSGMVVAIKRVRTEGAVVDEKAIRREIDIYTRLRELPNDHLLEVKDVFRDPGSYALVTEFAEGGSLWDLMGGDAADEQRMALDELTVLTIAEEIIDGLAVLHDNDIVHRDIKPQNVLRCDDVWKIADFGISKLMNNPVTGYTFQGAHTAPWAPPEQIQGAAAHPSADIYAWGRVVVFLLTGRTAVDAVSDVPSAWRELLTACTSVLPEQRPEASAVQGSLGRDLARQHVPGGLVRLFQGHVDALVVAQQQGHVGQRIAHGKRFHVGGQERGHLIGDQGERLVRRQLERFVGVDGGDSVVNAAHVVGAGRERIDDQQVHLLIEQIDALVDKRPQRVQTVLVSGRHHFHDRHDSSQFVPHDHAVRLPGVSLALGRILHDETRLRADGHRCQCDANSAGLERKPMNSKDISNAKDPDLRASHEALRRASELARKTAIQTGTDLIIVRDGKTVRIPPDAIHEQSQPKPVPTP
jgi:ATP-dependent Lon protease